MSDEEREAHRLLDLVRAGDDSIPDSVILWALRVTGDAIGLRT